jgi:hypothetical protein
VLGLADKAVQVVEKALERDNEKVAVGVLKHLGAIRRPPRGATDPEVVQLQMDLAREREKYRALMGMTRHLLKKAGLSPSQQRQYLRQHGRPELPGPDGEGKAMAADELLTDRPPLDMSKLEQILRQGDSEPGDDETDDETDRATEGATDRATPGESSHAPNEAGDAQVPCPEAVAYDLNGTPCDK